MKDNNNNNNLNDRTALNRYYLPVPKQSIQKIDRTSSPAHIGKLRNAIDFIVPENTPVLAATDGIITFVKDDSQIGGPNPAYWNFSNFIAIMHENKEFSRYDHLIFKSSNVKVGQSVKQGQKIAEVGMTGYTFIPHLHFQIFIFTGPNIFADYDTLIVNDFIDL
jgi:murein DD-endopeptidase MepM/ murein hydrolase activator NlpD